uniref:NADH dehydrogenase subunit 3 n=1 Tax=Anaka burmensis TaxID=2026963 RepID=UPI0025520BC2|nr:NADH dehydrogenase subunit 3 [Anaka burmensis]UNZ99516.1 NADH dehydrogenase subunit 3 [Anaka burmensis]
MNLILKYILLVIIIVIFLTLLLILISSKFIMDTQKSSPFECGFNSMTYKRLPFSIHFFLIAVIFLVFDIEIIIIMPMILTMKSSMINYWLLTSILFIIILVMGLYHEWYNGMLNWSN